MGDSDGGGDDVNNENGSSGGGDGVVSLPGGHGLRYSYRAVLLLSASVMLLPVGFVGGDV